MATFTHGSKTRLYWHGYDVSAFFNSASSDLSKDTAEVTAFGDVAKRYIAGLKDGTLSAEGMYESSIAGSDRALRAALDTDEPVITLLREGDAAGSPGDGLSGPLTAYSISSPVDDVTKVTAEAQSSHAIEALVSLLAKAAQPVGTLLTPSVDNGAATTNGLAAYLHAFEVAGTLDVTVQHSTDNVTWVDLVTFAQVAANNKAARAQAAGTVNRYLRVRAVVATGAATFHVAAGRLPQ